MLTFLLLAITPASVLAHGDALLVDDVLVLDPGASARFDGELHYHRVVGEVVGDGPVRVRLVASGAGEEALAIGPGSHLSFNVLVRCCDEAAWAPHTLIIDNPTSEPVTLTARASLVHDDLAVMVDGAESATRAFIGLFAVGWAMLVWRTTRRRDTPTPLRGPAIGLASIVVLVLGSGSYATVRYGVGGAPGVVAGTADLPVLPMNPVVSRASLMMGLSMVGWAVVALWWVRARPRAPTIPWITLGVMLAGSVLVVAASIFVAYGGLLVQTAWLVSVAGPILVVLITSSPSMRSRLGHGDPVAV